MTEFDAARQEFLRQFVELLRGGISSEEAAAEIVATLSAMRQMAVVLGRRG